MVNVLIDEKNKKGMALLKFLSDMEENSDFISFTDKKKRDFTVGEYDEQYLKGLRKKATQNWLGKINPDKWLREVREGTYEAQ
jgi:hypothetical protein